MKILVSWALLVVLTLAVFAYAADDSNNMVYGKTTKISQVDTTTNTATNCICTEEYAPVCGSDGTTYSNKCFAGCMKISIAYEGDCKGIEKSSSVSIEAPIKSISVSQVASAVASCVVDESLQKEINTLMVNLQEAEKSGDSSLMTEIKQKITSLGNQIDAQREKCKTQVSQQPTSSIDIGANYPTTVAIGKPTQPADQNLPSTTTTPITTSACSVDETLVTQWKELITQLQNAVASNNTELVGQLGSKAESLGLEIAGQMVKNCTLAGTAPSVDLFCPSESAQYSSLEKQKNSLMAQEYQARTSGNTELATQLQEQLSALSNEMETYSKQCQTKLLNSGFAQYFMTAPTKTYVSSNVSSTKSSTSSVVSTPVSAATSIEGQTQVASICYIPYELETKLKDAWNEYYALVQGNETIDMDKMGQIKATISSTESEINKIKQNCQQLQPTSTAETTISTVCPMVIQPTFEQECSAKNGTVVKKFDAKGCLSSYECAPQGTVSQTVPGQAIKPVESCTVPVELTQEFEGLWNTYKKALELNNTQQAEEIKAKISIIEEKISEAKGQCVKTIVTESAGTNDVVSYYKQKITEVLTQETDTDSQIIQLKNLRNEIDNLIVSLLEKNNQLNASEVSGVIDEIKVKKNSVQAGTATVETTTARIMTQINNKDVEVNPTETGVIIKDANITVTSSDLTIKENKVMIADQIVQTTPSIAIEKAKMQNTKEFNLSIENGVPVYDMTGEENRKLFGVIPVTIEKQVKIDASNGDVIKEDTPWWSVLTTS